MINNQNNLENIKEVEFMRKQTLRKILSKSAMERLYRVKIIKPNIVAKIEEYLIGLYQNGKVNKEVSENQIKMILDTVNGKTNININRK